MIFTFFHPFFLSTPGQRILSAGHTGEPIRNTLFAPKAPPPQGRQLMCQIQGPGPFDPTPRHRDFQPPDSARFYSTRIMGGKAFLPSGRVIIPRLRVPEGKKDRKYPAGEDKMSYPAVHRTDGVTITCRPWRSSSFQMGGPWVRVKCFRLGVQGSRGRLGEGGWKTSDWCSVISDWPLSAMSPPSCAPTLSPITMFSFSLHPPSFLLHSLFLSGQHRPGPFRPVRHSSPVFSLSI